MKILFFRKHPIAIADDSVDSEGEKGAKGHKPKKAYMAYKSRLNIKLKFIE